MNPEEIRKQLDEAIARLKVLQAQETRSEEETTEVRTLIEKSKRLNDELRAALDAADLIKNFDEARGTSAGRVSGNDGAAAAAENRSEAGKEETRSAGEILTSDEGYAKWAERRSDVPFEFNVETRALMNTAKLTANWLVEQRLPGIRRDSDLYGSLRDVLAVGSTSAETIRFIREDTFTNNAAFVTEATATGGSSGLKPESDITFEEDSANVGTIAHWLAITNFLEWNAPELRSYIDGRLLDGLNLREDDALLNGNGSGANPTGLLNVTGVLELDDAYFASNPTRNAGSSAEVFDRIARAKRVIQDDSRARANFVVMNPEDEEYFQTWLDADGRYIAGGPFAAGLAPNFWGLRKVINENMPAGQVLVGDGSEAQIWDRMSARITVGLVNDQFIRNMKTILAEKRVGLAVYKPSAFAVVDLIYN